jgi:hypothetical protein
MPLGLRCFAMRAFHRPHGSKPHRPVRPMRPVRPVRPTPLPSARLHYKPMCAPVQRERRTCLTERRTCPTERPWACIALQCVHPVGMQGPFNETLNPSDGTPLGVGPCPCKACEACPLVGLALMRKRIRARVAFEPL